ncbi:MAG TPA: hypothetical protein VMO26_10135 [Vicinamibacterales bacterium]|nr:hypothetical protein [Vicinamibacterales bacterium]
MERRKGTLVVVGLPVLASALVLVTAPSAQRPASGCSSAAPNSGQAALLPSHAYFVELVARPDCMAAFSLRDSDQLARFTHGPKSVSQRITYDPASDPDPRRQDAAKVLIPAGDVSLRSTIRLPIGTTDGTATLITWDAWFGAEFRHANTGIANYKNFQFASPAKRIWFEVRTRFAQAEAPSTRRAVREARGRKGQVAGRPATPGTEGAKPMTPQLPSASSGERVAIGVVDARAYGGGGAAFGPNVVSGGSLSPKAGSFTIRAETWTRYWVLIEQRANDWDLVSLWVSDENTDPVLIIDRRQLSVRGSVDEFWLQYNTSTQRTEGLGQRVGYARNVVMLRNVPDVSTLLRRPVK